MSRTQRHAKSITQPKVGVSATLSNLLGGRGTSAPSTHRPRTTLALFAISLVALLVSASSALAAPPTTTCCSILDVSYASVELKGEVTSPGNGFGTTQYTFQYSTDEVDWKDGYTDYILTGAVTNKEVTGKISGLKDGTKYYVRLFATTFVEQGTSPKPNPSFTTLVADPASVISLDDASNVEYTQAEATGEIDRPVKSDDVTCNFEYITDDAYNANPIDSRFTGATPVPCEPENPVATTGNVPVSAKFTGLSPSTTYHLRLAISNVVGPDSQEAANTFTTAGPVPKPTVLATANATEVEYTQAQVKGEVQRPAGKDPALNTECRFEYVTQTQFEEEEFAAAEPNGQIAGCNENPITEASADVAGKQAVTATLPGLLPSTTYHLRLTASNQGGSDSEDAVATFTTTGPIPKPTVIATKDATDVTIHEATVKGEVQRPAGKDPALDVNCRFEYVTQAQFEAEEFAAAGPNGQVVGCIENPITEATADGEGKQAVSGQLTNLKAGTTFHLRLLAENGGGTDTKVAAGTFVTEPADLPTVTIDPVEGGTYTTAHITGTVTLTDGHTSAGGPVVQFSSDGGATWSSKGMGWRHGDKDSKTNVYMSVGEGLYSVEADLTGLQPSTTYVFRIAASYASEFLAPELGGPGIPYYEALGEVAHSPEPNPSITTEPLQAPPTAEDLAVTDITATTANFSATVDPHAPAGPLSPLAKKAFATKWHFECTPECKNANGNEIGGTVQGEEGAQTVTGDAKRLDPNTCYEVRLVIHSEGGDETIVETFCTPLIKPTVKAFPGGSDGNGGYVLQGSVNPNASEVTDCTFGWGPGAPASDGTKPTDYAFQQDCSPNDPGAGAKPVTVEAPLASLQPGSTYQFRLFATNEAGEEMSEILEFKPELAKAEPCENEQQRTESNSNSLPECRAYELVTPMGKEGFGAFFETFDGGDRVAFNSNATNIARSGQGKPIGNFYVAGRTATGWETIPNLNGSSGTLQDAPSNVDSDFGNVILGGYSRDLKSSVWSLHRQGEPGVGCCTAILHRRSPDGTFALIGSPIAAGPGVPPMMMSADLSHVVAWNSPSRWGLGVYEFLGTGMDEPRRVDVDNSGSPISTCAPFGNAQGDSLSSDGTRVVFSVFGGCGGGNPPAGEIWARVNGTTSFDVSASHCTRTSADPGGVCNGPTEPGGCVESFQSSGGYVVGSGCRTAKFAAATSDGSRVFFTTTQQLVDADTDQTNDIYACDLPSGNPTPTAERANHCAAFRLVSGAKSNADVEEEVRNGAVVQRSGFLAASDNGDTVLFAAKGVLADNEDALKEKAVAGDHNLYVWRADAAHPDGQTSFVGRLDSNDITAQSTSDGRYLVFTTASQLLDTDTDDARDVYRYDADTGELTRVSTNVFGVAGNGDFDAATADPTEHNLSPTISDDGSKIVFTTTEALSPADGNAEPDVYLWTPSRVSLISTGSSGFAPRKETGGDAGSILTPKVAIAPSGEDIYFESPQPLTPADGDSANDVYDARIDGGFSFAPPPICIGEKCQPDPTPPSPNPPSPANQPNGEGNVKSPKPCPKGKVRKKNGKCVKKHKKHHKKSHKKTGHNRGGSK